MSAHLRLVDPATGELEDGCPKCKGLEGDVEALQGLVTRQERQIKAMRRERDKERLADKRRAVIEHIHEKWQTATGHPNSGLTGERHDGYKSMLNHYEAQTFDWVIAALAEFPYERFGKRYRDGKPEDRKDDLGWACEMGRRFENLANIGFRLVKEKE